MKLLVTGADGLLGSAVARAARERGHEVVEGVRASDEATETRQIGATGATGATGGTSGTSGTTETGLGSGRRSGIEPSRRTGSPATEVGPSAETGSRVSVDVTDRGRVSDVVSGVAPDAVVHCAGYTDVDGAEAHRDEAFEVNVSGSRWIGRAAAAAGSLVLLPSTDYVFDGTASRPYRPGDAPNPINLYGKSKWMAEEEVRMSGARWLVVRTSWLYGAGGGNFVDAILDAARDRVRRSGREEGGGGESRPGSLRVVDDQRGRPTWTGSLAPALIELLELELVEGTVTEPPGPAEPREPAGFPGWNRGGTAASGPIAPVAASAPGRTLHLADRGDATWYELAVEALDLAGVDAELVPVSSEEWGAAAARPGYSVLDLEDAEGVLGRRMPPWRESLRRYLCSAEEGSS